MIPAMRRKKGPASIQLFLGIFFLIFAVSWSGVGIGALIAMGPQNGFASVPVVGIVFAVLGLAFGVASIALLIAAGKRRARYKRLMREGTCYPAEVINAYYTNTTFNGRAGIVVECMYTDVRGESHLVKSDTLWHLAMLGQQPQFKAQVWVDSYDPKQYHVEVERDFPAGNVLHDDR